MRHIRRRCDARKWGGWFSGAILLFMAGCGANPQGGSTDNNNLGLWTGDTTGTPTPQVKGDSATAGTLTVNTTTLNFGDTSSAQELEFRNSGGGTISYRIRSDSAWVTTDAQEGTVSGEIDRVAVLIDRAQLSVGAHTAFLTIESDTAAPFVVQIAATVAGDDDGAGDSTGPSGNTGRLYVSTNTLDFGSASRSRSFLVRNRESGSTLEYAATADAAWISLVGAAGASTGEYDAVRVSVDRTGLSAGDYVGHVTVAGGGEQAVLQVKMRVDAAASQANDGPELYVNPVELNFGSTQTKLVFLVRNAGTGTLNYTVTPRVSWAISSVNSASNTGRYDSVRITVDRANLTPGDYTGSIDVAADNGQSQSVAVRMTVRDTGGNAGGGGSGGDTDPPPSLEVSTNFLDFGTQRDALFFTVRNGGGGKLNYTITADAAWVKVEPAAGDSTGEPDAVQVTVDRNLLEIGSAQAVLTVLTTDGAVQEVAILAERADTDAGDTDNGSSLVQWPASDARIDNITDLSQYALRNAPYWYGFALEQWTPVPLVSLLVINVEVGNNAGWLNQLQQTLVGANSAIVYGTYISGGDCRKQADMRYYPSETIPYESLPPEAFLTEYNYDGDERAVVNVGDPAVAALYADLIVAEVANRHKPTLFMDNIRHPHSGGTKTPWATMMGFVGGIRARLNAAGTRVVINIAGLPWAMAGTPDAQLLQDAVDGMCFEMPFHRNIRTSSTLVASEISVYRHWLDAGKNIQLIATWIPDGGQRDDQRKFLAAMTMVTRRPGDSIFVARGFHEQAPDWADWPTRFGAALGDYTFVPDAPGLTVQREFEHAVLTVNVAATLDAAGAATAVTVTWK